MRLERFFMPDWMNVVEIGRLDAQIDRMRQSRRGERSRAFDAGAREVARVALVTRALAELMIAKGLITKDELLAQIERVDLEDGVADGALDPSAVVPGAKFESPPPERRPPSPKVLARAREKVQEAREAHPQPKPPPRPELLARAKEHLRAVREKKRRKNLP